MICRFLKSTASPQSALPSLSPTPQLFEAMVRFLTPEILTAWMRFIGTPQMPKPPTSKSEPSLMPLMAYSALLQILENWRKGLRSREESINNLFILIRGYAQNIAIGAGEAENPYSCWSKGGEARRGRLASEPLDS